MSASGAAAGKVTHLVYGANAKWAVWPISKKSAANGEDFVARMERSAIRD
jgi:hypothetical protein